MIQKLGRQHNDTAAPTHTSTPTSVSESLHGIGVHWSLLFQKSRVCPLEDVLL